MEDYIDLVIAKLDEDHIVLRAPWNTVRAGDTVYVRGDGNYRALEVIAERKTKALMELPKVTAIMLPLEYNDEPTERPVDLNHRRRKESKTPALITLYIRTAKKSRTSRAARAKKGVCAPFLLLVQSIIFRRKAPTAKGYIFRHSSAG